MEQILARLLAATYGAFLPRIILPQIAMQLDPNDPSRPVGIGENKLWQADAGTSVEVKAGDTDAASPADASKAYDMVRTWRDNTMAFDDDQPIRTMQFNSPFMEKLDSRVRRLVADLEKDVFLNVITTGILKGAGIRFVGSGGLTGGGSDSAVLLQKFNENFTQGAQVALAEADLPLDDHIALLAPQDVGYIRSIPAITEADKRGEGASRVQTWEIGTYNGARFFGTTNLPLLGGKGTYSTPQADGAHAKEATEVATTGVSGNPLWDVITFGNDKNKYIVTGYDNGYNLTLHKPLAAQVADDAVIKLASPAGGWRPSLVYSRECFQYQPLSTESEVTRAAGFMDWERDVSSGLELQMEAKRKNHRTQFIASAGLWSGIIPAGFDIQVPA